MDYETADSGNIEKASGVIFGGKVCKKCEVLKHKLIPELLKKACGNSGNDKFFLFVNIDKPENILLLMNLEKQLGTDGAETPVLLWNDHLYYGNDAVRNLIDSGPVCHTSSLSMEVLKKGISDENSIRTLKKRADVLKTSAVLGAGFLDGINPCVFSTLVFFMSMLGVARIKGRKLLMVGAAYCISCFFTYLLLGFGALQTLKLLAGFDFLRVILNVLTVFFLVLCAALSFKDAWAYYKSGNPDDVKLKLPDSLKKRINSLFRKKLSSGYLIPASFILGFIVTLLESVCTGQVYVPILILLSKENLFSKWFFFLLIYNFAFILPLIGVFLFTYMGVSVNSMLKMSRKNVIYSKIMLGGMFIALTAVIIFLEFF
jgi:cytochrome c biogenesis protein CcdA